MTCWVPKTREAALPIKSLFHSSGPCKEQFCVWGKRYAQTPQLYLPKELLAKSGTSRMEDLKGSKDYILFQQDSAQDFPSLTASR